MLHAFYFAKLCDDALRENFFQAIADLREREREWEGKEERMGVVTEERDRAEATLREHGLSPDNNIDVSVDMVL